MFARTVDGKRLGPPLRAACAVALAVLFACAPLRQTVAPEAPGAAVLVGAGDIAQCGQVEAARSRAAQTAALIEPTGATVFAAGDLAYSRGTAGEFEHCYDPTWGRFKARTLPVPGNHEYLSENAQPYFDYWGAQAGARGKGYYAVNVGTWRVIALNSNIDAGPGSQQALWLEQELARQPHACTLAFWHHPVFSSGYHGDNPHMAALWKLLFDAGAELIINGHEHNYERFAPLDDRGAPDARRGLRQIIVGTGGAALRGFQQARAHSDAREDGTYGVLKLTLRPGAYEWAFIAVGGAFRDRGSGTCHD